MKRRKTQVTTALRLLVGMCMVSQAQQTPYVVGSTVAGTVFAWALASTHCITSEYAKCLA